MSTRGGLRLAFVGSLIAGIFAACSDSQAPVEREPAPLPSTPFLVSDPVGSPSGGPNVSYVSLPPGALAGTTVNLHVVRSGLALDVPLSDGGFDPVAVVALAGDTITAALPAMGSAGAQRFTFVVPDTASPVVVRTSPGDHKLRVPPTDSIKVTFSEPMNGASFAGSLVLSAGGTPTAGSLVPAADPARALQLTFVPAARLAPHSTYQFRVRRTALDLDGDSLRTEFQADFTTDSIIPTLSLVVYNPRSGDTVPDNFPRILFQVTSDLGLLEVGLSAVEDGGASFDGFTGGNLDWIVGRSVTLGTGRVPSGSYTVRLTASDTAGHSGTSTPFRLTFAPPDSQPRIVVRSFEMIELEGAPGSGFWFYAPQVMVAESPGQAGLEMVGFELLDIPGFPPPSMAFYAHGLPVPPDRDVQLFPEAYGDYPMEFYLRDGSRSNGGSATIRLTYVDAGGRFHSTTVQGPIVAGALPSTYTGGCGHWSYAYFGILPDYSCPSYAPLRIEIPTPSSAGGAR